MRARAVALVAALLASVALPGCGPYLFRQSDRLTMVYPADHARVAEPVTVRWTAQGFQPPADGSYAVFVDRDPMPPGDGLDDFPPHDRDGIHIVQATSLRIDALARQVGVDPAEQDRHDVTVVLLDRSGHRIGEYAAFSEFTVVRGGGT